MELTAKPDSWNKSLAENISFVSQVINILYLNIYIYEINIFSLF